MDINRTTGGDRCQMMTKTFFIEWFMYIHRKQKKSDVRRESFKRRVYGHKQDNRGWMPSDDKLFLSGNHKGRVYGIINPISALVVIVACLFLFGHRDQDIGILLTSLTLPHLCACPKP